MLLHQTIKNQITEALRAKDTVRLNTLRGLQALFLNEMLSQKVPSNSEFLPDDKVLTLIKRSVNQRRDSIRLFELGKRMDLANKESAELVILQSFLPPTMSQEEIRVIAVNKINEIRANGPIDVATIGKITGIIMKELAGKAEGGDVKAVIEGLIKH
ncbi:MAG: GatB/YqeY domain-containing protein [Candidatus Paceibacterota bacterium]|jgi:hypothetical protein